MGASMPPLLPVTMTEEERTTLIRQWCDTQNTRYAVVAALVIVSAGACMWVTAVSWWTR